MGRYSKQELDEIKQTVDLVALVQSKGIQLEAHGRDNLKGLCPFHDDSNPSLIVTPAKGLWNCPACGKGGDVIRFVQLHDGVSFRHAVEILRENAAAAMGGEKKRKAYARKLKPPVELDADDQQQLNDIVDYYHTRLLETEPAKDYLKSRGIYCEEAIATFKLGVADRTLGLRVPTAGRKDGAALREQLKKIGILRQKTGHEHLNGCLTVPIFDNAGNVTEVYGRRLNDKNRNKGASSHFYLPGPHKGVWNPAGITGGESTTRPGEPPTRSVILCESIIDALTFWVHGFRNVTASYGTGGFTNDILAAFLDAGVSRVFIAYDRDRAGDDAAQRLAEQLTAEGLRCHRVQFPRGLDANAYAQQVTPVRKHFDLLLNSAPFMDTRGAAPHPGKEPAAPCTPQKAAQHVAPGEEVAESAKKREAPADSATSSPAETSQAKTGVERDASLSPPEASSIPCEQRGEDFWVTLGKREYRVRGLARNQSFDVMKVNVRVTVGALFHVDTFDLYNARHRKAYLHVAAEECKLEPEVVKRDLGRLLLKLEEIQEKNLSEEPEREREEVELDDEEREEALELLRSPQLLQRVAEDFELAGLVGEGANALVAYLAGVSRKTDDPLAVIIQSSSSAGKSSVMDAVLAMMPDEEQIRYTAMTGQSLFYMGETELAHKILAISEEEGAEQAGYALKILQSEKKLRIASTGKDPKTGRLVTQEYHVEGPCVIFMTTTSIEIDEELQNRCVVLTVNENREQTRRIHQLQRQSRTLAGLLRGEDKKRVIRVHQNAQRLLRSLMVVNPFAEQLTFADGRLRTRRDHMKYLNLINTVALLHQYQREVKTVTHQGEKLEYVEATLADVEAANKLAAAVLGTSLDELPPQTRKLLDAVYKLACERAEADEIELADVHLTRREIREHTGWGNTQLGIHLERLVDHEYLFAYRNGRGLAYEVHYNGEGRDGKPFVLNLLDTQKLRYDDNRTGANPKDTGCIRPEFGAHPESPKPEGSASKRPPKEPLDTGADEKRIVGPAETLERRSDPEERAS